MIHSSATRLSANERHVVALHFCQSALHERILITANNHARSAAPQHQRVFIHQFLLTGKQSIFYSQVSERVRQLCFNDAQNFATRHLKVVKKYYYCRRAMEYVTKTYNYVTGSSSQACVVQQECPSINA